MKDQSNTVEKQLKQIANLLVTNNSFLGDSGLWFGKIGVTVFFFHYARYVNSEKFENYAVEIVNSLQEEIHRHSIARYDRGLAGIGVGIEYLSQNSFLEGDMDMVLKDFDQRIRHDIMYDPQENNSLANGLCGLGQYLLYRLQNRTGNSNELCLLINQESMVHVVNLVENDNNLQPDDLPDILSFLCRLYAMDICNPKIDRCMDKILDNFNVNAIREKLLPTWILALLRLSAIRDKMADTAIQVVEKYLKTIEAIGISPTKNQPQDAINQLLWLMQCKRLIKPASISMEVDSRINALAEKIFNPKEEEILFEKGKLSLRGSAGTGLAMMTLSGKCDDAWLDLIY